MESPGKKFTDLVEIESIQDTDLAVIRNDTGVKKTPMQKLSDYIKQKFIGWVFSDLPTQDKTITGALKELNSALVKKIEYDKEIPLNETVLGQQVYAKVVEIPVLPNATDQSYNTDISGARYAWLDTSDSYIYTRAEPTPGYNTYPLPYASATNLADSIAVRVDDHGKKVTFMTRGDWTLYGAFIVIKYYK